MAAAMTASGVPTASPVACRSGWAGSPSGAGFVGGATVGAPAAGPGAGPHGDGLRPEAAGRVGGVRVADGVAGDRRVDRAVRGVCHARAEVQRGVAVAGSGVADAVIGDLDGSDAAGLRLNLDPTPVR